MYNGVPMHMYMGLDALVATHGPSNGPSTHGPVTATLTTTTIHTCLNTDVPPASLTGNP